MVNAHAPCRKNRGSVRRQHKTHLYMKMKIKELCLVVLITISYSAEAQQGFHKTNAFNGNQADKNTTRLDLHGKRTPLLRHKRGWGSILFTGVSILTRVTSLGLTLASALSEGCALRRNICVYKGKIEKYENEITHLQQQYEAVYLNTKRTYLDLKTATINNGYIEYYINHTMQTVENLQDIEENLSDELQLKLPKMYEIFDMSKNYSFQQYLGVVVGQLEYRLKDIKDMLHDNKRNALIGIVVQYVIEATLNKFVKAFKTAYEVIDNEDIIATTNKGFWWEREDGEATVKTRKGKVIKLKLVPKTLKQMVKNAGKSFRNFGKSVRKWGRIKNWKGFKGKLAHTFRKPLDKLRNINIKNFFNPKKNAQFVKNYKISWSQRFMTGFGIAADVISQIIMDRQWAALEQQMKTTLDKYEKYKSKLVTSLKTIKDEEKKMDDSWLDLIKVFRILSLTFKSLITNATKYSNFSEVVGLPKLPVDTSTPLFTIDFDNTDKRSLKSNQLAVIHFLKSVDYNMSVIEDQMRARLVLYNYTLSKSEYDESVVDLLSDVTSILNFSPSMTMKTYGRKLGMKDILCTVSILRPDMTEYDSYSLEPFRPRCEVNALVFKNLALEASSKRKIELMRRTVKRIVNSQQDESLSMLLHHVHTAYHGLRDKDIAQFGASITEQDIICLISKEYPTRLTFDFIPLDTFRPDCSAITTENFNKLMQDASKLKSITKGLQNDLETCQKYKFCPCLSQLAQNNNVREADIKRVLLKIEPTWKPNDVAVYCSPTGCGCDHL